MMAVEQSEQHMTNLSGNKSNSADAAGLSSAVIAYCFWGFMPLYWHLMAEASHVEVLAHRIIWSLLFIALMLFFKGQLFQTLATCRTLAVKSNRKVAGIIVLASMFASLNWLINIVGVNTGRVVELGLGMFLTPLATVAIGIAFFSERLTRIKALAMGFAACSVVILASGLDRFPWIAVGVSSTWAIYGALKKKVAIAPMDSVFVEHVLMFAPALGFLCLAPGGYAGHFCSGFDSGLSWILMGTGVMTSIPMILFSLAAQRLPMTMLGVIQYLNPVLTLAVGVFVFAEPVAAAELGALVCILAAVFLFVASSYLPRR